jgi:hypothetical protein
MAQFNRGYGLMTYARCLYDPGQHDALVVSTHTDMTKAIANLDAHPEYGDRRLCPAFVAEAGHIAEHIDMEAFAAIYDPNALTLGEEALEQAYRKWCLSQSLFLNPLNDAGPHAITACDEIQLPTFVTTIGEHRSSWGSSAS